MIRFFLQWFRNYKAARRGRYEWDRALRSKVWERIRLDLDLLGFNAAGIEMGTFQKMINSLFPATRFTAEQAAEAMRNLAGLGPSAKEIADQATGFAFRGLSTQDIIDHATKRGPGFSKLEELKRKRKREGEGDPN